MISQPINLKQYKVICFDFDGVIVESEHVKAKAFQALYEPYGAEIGAEVLRHHLANGGVSRHEKFRYYHEQFLNQTLSAEEVDCLADSFSEIVEKQLIQTDYVAGVIDFLEMHYQQCPLYVISATPEPELKRIIAARGLNRYFKNVYGSPTPKADTIATIVKSEQVSPDQVLMIGDASTDFDAADANQTGFLARATQYNTDIFPKGTPMIANFTEILTTKNAETPYACVQCGTQLQSQENHLACEPCQTQYLIQDGIPVFAKKRGYWCNVAREKMHQMIQDAETSGDWVSAVNKHIERYALHITPLFRADAQFMFPINSESRVLDAGSMWGGLTIPIAQFAKTVYAVDQTWETLRFLKVRSQQMGLNNVIPVESSIHQLPFPDHYFDFVVLNGVLEWLGMEQEVVLEKHWDHKREDQHQYKKSPEAMQLAALRELHRVIKPGGGIYIAIENRLGLQYFLGHPDDHVNVRFVTFLPRFLANMITRFRRNMDYRTYIYSPNKLAALVEQAGFKTKQMYAAYPHYNKISRLIPFSIFSNLKQIAKDGYAHIKIFVLSAAWKLIPEPLGKYFSPSIALLAAKDEFALSQRLLHILTQQGLIKADESARYELALVNNRFGNGHTTNYLVYDTVQQKPVYFCKMSRTQDATALASESAQLMSVKTALQQSELADTIPQLLFYDKLDSISLQVSSYMPAKPISYTFLNGLRNLPRFVPTQHRIARKAISFIQQLGRRRWLQKIDPWVVKGINWLVLFQKQTQNKTVLFGEQIDQWLNDAMVKIQQNGIDVQPFRTIIEQLKQSLQAGSGKNLPIVMQHGDYDLCNLLQFQGKLRVVDFEHMQTNTLPFFDLANLLFSSFLSEWKLSAPEQSLKDYAEASGWHKLIQKWVRLYANQMGIDPHLLRLLPKLAALEQNAKQYPHYRDPYDYPMYGNKSFTAMMSWELCDL